MWRLAFVLACTAALSVVGLVVGLTVHGSTTAAIIPTVAGGMGGFGIGSACLDVLRRWRSCGPKVATT
jgi:hypothetical protein